MMCLKRKYGDNFEFADFLIEDAKASLSRLLAFKTNIEYRMIALNENYGKAFSENDLMLQDKLVAYQQAIENAARDNFDFPGIIKIVLDQVTLTESYYQQNQSHAHPLLLYSSLNTIKHICQTILGLRLEQETVSKDHLPILDKLLQFRFNVRNLALKDESFEEFLVLCDEIRDELKHDGLLLSDGKVQSIWKFRKG
jgi:cysteinyl-tRNA synthetase